MTDNGLTEGKDTKMMAGLVPKRRSEIRWLFHESHITLWRGSSVSNEG
jgi:hypothetical protein